MQIIAVDRKRQAAGSALRALKTPRPYKASEQPLLKQKEQKVWIQISSTTFQKAAASQVIAQLETGGYI